MNDICVHMLWVKGSLSFLETNCVQSFVRNGFDVMLWSYGEEARVEGATTRDAREVLPEEAIFLNQRGSFAGFSDLFRYAVLQKFGGLYSDIDVVAMRPAHELPRQAFLVTERARTGGVKINGNIIHLPHPSAGDLVDLALVYAQAFPKSLVTWSEIGPSLLSAIVNIHPRHGFQIMPPEFANPFNWWDCPDALFGESAPEDSFFLHLYNEMWRVSGRNKNVLPAVGTILHRAWDLS